MALNVQTFQWRENLQFPLRVIIANSFICFQIEIIALRVRMWYIEQGSIWGWGVTEGWVTYRFPKIRSWSLIKRPKNGVFRPFYGIFDVKFSCGAEDAAKMSKIGKNWLSWFQKKLILFYRINILIQNICNNASMLSKNIIKRSSKFYIFSCFEFS